MGSPSLPAMGCGGSKAQPTSEEVSAVDRKPSITITLSSDGEAEDDDGVVVDEELREKAELWTKQEEKVIEDEMERGMEDVLEVAKEDIIASLESEDNNMEKA